MKEISQKDNKVNILIVDDDQDIVQTIKGHLKLEGYETLVAYDGKSAIEIAKSNKPDMIILDLSLPDIDGLMVCKNVRREIDLPIIMLTARDTISDKVLGFECGADDYIVKPFDFLELSARIKAVLNRYRKDIIRDEVVIKDLVVNLRARNVFIRGEKVRLTKTEFDLLKLFVYHPGEVLSREFIRKQIWRDSQLYDWTRTVDVHIQRLRKKIELDTKNPEYIITVPGAGYKLKEA